MKSILVLHGPNLDRLGRREPEIYGRQTLADLEALLRTHARGRTSLEFFQSNHEGALIDRIAEATDNEADGLIFNPGALTHTSIALRDALAGSDLPCIEVHLSNIYRREPFRHHSHTAAASLGVISGLGFHGYLAALDHLLDHARG
ncbi:MAG: type II 3-dehydroquinate dehydratase [Puniceicoccaceae bacterium]|nr:MAG: type II 3-dehydroquinate dehydratase [Puniceicoccaceae bacterium]